ncbi:hypothetical protein [Streptomyces sp. SID685]|uniref:hypothetical protein n=1 Tax=Streptomyces sp. SID685 TaxID=2690322 RepID=UPI001F2DE731|nr:hypothetical protein [Streptomyces sp. SID685]
MPYRQDTAGIEVLSMDYQALMAAAAEVRPGGLGARRAAVVPGLGHESSERYIARETA